MRRALIWTMAFAVQKKPHKNATKLELNGR